MNFIRTNKIYCHSDRLLQWIHGEKPRPITVEVHPSNVCSNKCYYCMYDKKDTAVMAQNDLLTVIGKLHQIGVRGLIYSGGGEPLMNPGFNKSLILAHSLGFDVGIITNGTELDEERIDLIRRKATWIRISLDSDSATNYRTIRGVDKFNQVVDNICSLAVARKNTPLTIGVQAIVLKENYGTMYEIAKMAKDMEVDYFQYRPLENAGYDDEILEVIYKDVAPHIKTLVDANFSVVDTDYKWNLIQNTRVIPCFGIDFIGAVDVHGDMYCCCHKIADNEKKMIYGNLITEDAATVMSRRKEVQKQLDLSTCPIACRGAALNQTLYSLLNIKHKNFL